MNCPTCKETAPSLSSCVNCATICCRSCGFKHLLEHNLLIPLTFEDEKEFEDVIPCKIKCKTCDGTGILAGLGDFNINDDVCTMTACEKCKGTGEKN